MNRKTLAPLRRTRPEAVALVWRKSAKDLIALRTYESLRLWLRAGR